MGKGKRIRATLRGKDPLRNMSARIQKMHQDANLLAAPSDADRAAQSVEDFYCDGDQYYYDNDDEYYYGWGIDLDLAWADHRRRCAVEQDDIALAVSSGWL